MKKIINHFGYKKQLRKLAEEMQELLYELSQPEVDRKKVTEEIADVQVLIDQFKHWFVIDKEDIEKLKKAKVARTLKRIREGYYLSQPTY